MIEWSVIFYIYMCIGFICGYYALTFLRPTEKQLKKMKEDKFFWEHMEKDMEEMWTMVESVPILVPALIFLIIFLWPGIFMVASNIKEK